MWTYSSIWRGRDVVLVAHRARSYNHTELSKKRVTSLSGSSQKTSGPLRGAVTPLGAIRFIAVQIRQIRTTLEPGCLVPAAVFSAEARMEFKLEEAIPVLDRTPAVLSKIGTASCR